MKNITDKIIVKRNEIIKASYKLTPNEQAIILTTISKMDRDISDQISYELNIKELSNITNTNEKMAYKYFKEAAQRLYRRELMFQSHGSNKLSRWVQEIEYIDHQGVIRINFSKRIIPYLTNIKENFTAYNLSHVVKFKSCYGVRFYELIKQWANTKSELIISIKEIKGLLQLSSSYNRMFNFKKKVIEPALKDINTFSDLHVVYDQKKTGRKVTHIIFYWKFKETKITTIKNKALPGESWNEAKSRLIDNRVNSYNHEF